MWSEAGDSTKSSLQIGPLHRDRTHYPRDEHGAAQLYNKVSSSPRGRAPHFLTGLGLTLALQSRHAALIRSQCPMHPAWKWCSQLGRQRSFSPTAKSSWQMAHVQARDRGELRLVALDDLDGRELSFGERDGALPLPAAAQSAASCCCICCACRRGARGLLQCRMHAHNRGDGGMQPRIVEVRPVDLCKSREGGARFAQVAEHQVALRLPPVVADVERRLVLSLEMRGRCARRRLRCRWACVEVRRTRAARR